MLGVDNWSNGWLPSLYQGTVVRPQEPRILNLDPPPSRPAQGPAELSRITCSSSTASISPSAPASSTWPPASPATSWPPGCRPPPKRPSTSRRRRAATHELYGLDDPDTKVWGERCLIARRLVERGVRFVQIPCGNQHWDHHGGIEKALPIRCKQTDQPDRRPGARTSSSAACSTRTLVHWGGEMGRLPVIQNEKNIGRDHNTYGFSIWLAGGGVKGGYVHGATDEFGHKAVENVVNHYDYHATLLHLFGLEQERLTFQRASGLGSLIDGQPARVVTELLA